MSPSILIPDEAALTEAIALAHDVFQAELLRKPAIALDPAGLASMLQIYANGGRRAEMVAAVQTSNEWHLIHDPQLPPFEPLPPMEAVGAFFRVNGQRWTGIETSDFNLLGRYVYEGPDVVRAVLDDRRAVGFNILRVWTRYGGDEVEPQFREAFAREIGYLQPREHAHFYDALLPDFCDLVASYGLYLNITAYCGGAREDHWERLGEVLPSKTNARLIELINEGDDYSHDIRVQDFAPLPGLICSHGSNASERTPIRPWWQWETAHFNDAFEWWRKSGHNGMEFSQGAEQLPGSHLPVSADENTRPDKDPVLRHHEDAARAAALLIAMYCHHSQSGKKSAVFTDFDRPYAEAVVRGMRSVDHNYQNEPYRHGSEEIARENALGLLRSYRRGDSPFADIRR